MYVSKDKRVAFWMDDAAMIQVMYDKDGSFKFVMILVGTQMIKIPVLEDAIEVVKIFNENNKTDVAIPQKNTNGGIISLDKRIQRPRLAVQQPDAGRRP